MQESFIVRIDFDPRDHTYGTGTAYATSGKSVVDGLPQQIPYESLSFRTAAIHGHGWHNGSGGFMPYHGGPYLRTVAMGQDYFVTGLYHPRYLFGGIADIGFLLAQGSPLAALQYGISAESHYYASMHVVTSVTDCRAGTSGNR